MTILNELAQQILAAKYYTDEETTPEQLFMRVAKVAAIPDVIDRFVQKDGTIASNLGDYFKPYTDIFNRVIARRGYTIDAALGAKEIASEYWGEETKKYYDAMCNLEFMPATPTLINAGRSIGMLSSCFFLRVPDSLEGIMETNKQTAIIAKMGGGVGLDISELRPKGSPVGTTSKGVSSGPVSFLRIFNETGMQVQQGGVRRAAMIAVMVINHPDILEFIKCKEEEGVLSNFNISVLIPDTFMEAIEVHPENIWICEWKNTQYIINKETDIPELYDANQPIDIEEYYRVKDIWEIIVDKAWHNGEPGIVFWDEVNRKDIFKGKFGKLGLNPCVPKDTWIMTLKGPRQVADLLTKDFSAAIDGENFPARKFIKTGSKQLVRITTKEGFQVKTTLNHLFRKVIGKRHVRDPNNYNGTRLTDYYEDWVPAGELNPGDTVRMHHHKNLPVWKGPGTYSDGYLLGLLIGDGYLTKTNVGKIEIWDDAGSQEMIDKVLEFVKTLHKRSDFKGFNYAEKTKKHTLTLAALHKLAKHYGAVQGNKHLTEKIEKTSYAFHVGFLRGFFDADGSVQGTQEKGVSVRVGQSSIDDLRIVQRMLLRIGIYSKIYKRREAGIHYLPDSNRNLAPYPVKASFELIISGEGLEIFLNKISFYHTQKRELLTNKVCNYKRNINKMKFIATVEHIELLPAENVYDTTVPLIHAFDGNGFYLHNCSEQFLVEKDSCSLAAINLGVCWYYSERDKRVRVDYDRLEALIKLGVQFLDNTLDINSFPLPEIEEQTLKIRRIGLGTMGLHDLMLRKEIRYGSKESLSLIDNIYSFIEKTARNTSTQLGSIRGVPDALKEFNVRNAGLLTVQPTGTVSIICNQTSPGIEPVFQWSFTRKDSYGTHQMKHFILEKFPNELPSYAVTALDIPPREHVLVQAQIQKYIDSGISKCLAKGTLIPTNKGIIPIENLGINNIPRTFGKPLKDLEVFSEDKNWHKVNSFYFGGIQNTIKITLNNGVILEGTENHKIMTVDGWKKLNELKIGAYTLTISRNFNKLKGKNKLPKLGKFNANANKISVPRYMSKNLATFLGMLAADGHTEETTGLVGLYEKNKKVGKLFDDLTKKLFKQSPKITKDKRTGVIIHAITSRVFCRWIESLIGKRAADKHIPVQILRGSETEILGFAKGVTLDGYIPQGALILYDGKSEQLARELCALTHFIGRAPYLGKKLVKSHNYYTYNVRIFNFKGIETHKISTRQDKDRLVKIPNKWHAINYLKLPADHPKYSAMRSIWQRKQKIAKQSTLKALNQTYPYDEYYVKVSKIEKSRVPVYDLEVENTHSYIVNGLLSHNTVNAPNSTTREQVDNIFRLAYKTKCKSTTIYRSGSRKTEVLIKEQEITKDSNESDEETTKQQKSTAPRFRGPVLFGATFKINTPGGKAYITINEDDYGLREVFVHISKAGSEITTHVEAEGRLISHSLKHWIPAKTIIGHLAGHKSNPIFDSGRSVKSVPDAVAIVMREYLDRYEGFSEYLDKENATPVTTPQLSGEISGELCPDCGEVLYQSGGCNYCYCGFSRCG